jgi:hypothetical protein
MMGGVKGRPCRGWWLGALLLLIELASGPACGLELDMLFQTKCVMEEINTNVLVVGDYAAYSKDDPNVPVVVDVKVGRITLS